LDQKEYEAVLIVAGLANTEILCNFRYFNPPQASLK
jgi:hypothetical protein